MSHSIDRVLGWFKGGTPEKGNSVNSKENGHTVVPSTVSQVDSSSMPTIVSFAGGRDYYYDAANALEANCEKLGLPHDIVRIRESEMDWADLCRWKINFYQEMSEKHGSILWTDVDNNILKVPEELSYTRFDMIGFGARFKYIREYDRYNAARFWVPSVLYFGDTPKAKRFIQLMADIEANTDERVTDDWVLHEAWLQHDFQMTVGFLPPNTVARKREQICEDTVFVYGESGSVSDFRGQVVQHENAGANPELRSNILVSESKDLMKLKRPKDALLLAERAVEVQPNNDAAIVQLSRYTKLAKDPIGSLELLESKRDEGVRTPLLLEELAKRYQQNGNFKQSRHTFQEIIDGQDLVFAPRAESQLYELELDERAQEMGLTKSQRPKMWWMKTPYPGNFGDILSPWIVEKVSGLPPFLGPRDKSLLAIGSVIKFATEKSTVWGSGTPRMDDTLSAAAKYKAVRGPLTRDLVLRSGGQCPEVYGDPALLLPHFYAPTAKTPRYKLGIIRHVAHERQESKFDGVKSISLAGVGESTIKRVVDEITDCEAILSTSLHGIIIANAYNIPARWCFFSNDPNAVSGDGTKYQDYFQSVGLPEQTPFDLAGIEVFSEELRSNVPEDVQINFDAERLIEAYHS